MKEIEQYKAFIESVCNIYGIVDAIQPLQNTINAFQLFLPSNYMSEIKSGRYRGHKKAYKYFRELPIISMFKKVDNFLDPEPLINSYQNDAQY